MSTVRAVIFDLGNVLIGWDPRNLYRDLIPDEAAREHFLAHVCNTAWNEQQDEGRAWADGVALLAAQFPEHRALIEAYDRDWHRMLSGPIAGTVALLEALEARGIPLYALTNWSAEKFPIAQARYAFLSLFDGIVVSGHERLKKPDPRIFQRLIERYGVVPEETLFIDDSALNIAGARALGLKTHRFETPERLREALVDLRLL